MIPALKVTSLSYHYGRKQVLDNVSFSVAPGRVTALLGPNGAGKTTLFSLVCRLLRSQRSEVFIAGIDIGESPEAALERVGIVFQQPTLDLDLTVKQNLHYFAALRGMPRALADKRIEAELDRLEIGQSIATTVRKLNGGHRRRVEIARALLHEPKLLLLDEPTVGLDVPTRQGFVEYAHSLASERGVGILWATHLIDEINEVEDHLVVINHGQIRAQGAVCDVMAHCGANRLVDAYGKLTNEVEK